MTPRSTAHERHHCGLPTTRDRPPGSMGDERLFRDVLGGFAVSSLCFSHLPLRPYSSSTTKPPFVASRHPGALLSAESLPRALRIGLAHHGQGVLLDPTSRHRGALSRPFPSYPEQESPKSTSRPTAFGVNSAHHVALSQGNFLPRPQAWLTDPLIR